MKCLPLVVVWGIENNKLANSKPHGPVKCCFPAEIILQKNLKNISPLHFYRPHFNRPFCLCSVFSLWAAVPVGRVQAERAGTWECLAGSALVGMWPRVGVRSLILIYLEVAAQGSLGEPKCVWTLNHVTNLKSPQVNPKQSHRGIVVLVEHRHGLAAPLSLPGKVLCCRHPTATVGICVLSLPSHPGHSPAQPSAPSSSSAV